VGAELAIPRASHAETVPALCLARDALPTGSPGRLRDTQREYNMKFVSAAALALIGSLVGFNSANAQGAAMKTTPTTKILAIGTVNPGLNNRRCLLSYRRKFGKLSTSTSMARSSSGTRYRESRAWRSSSTSPIRPSLTKCSNSCL